MRKTIIGVSLAIGLLVFNILVVFFGDGGVLATAELQAYHQGLKANLEELENIQFTLESRLDAIQNNARVLENAGHASGLVRPDEVRVRIEGSPEVMAGNSAGTSLAKLRPQGVDLGYLALAALLAGALVLLVLGGMRRESVEKATSTTRRRRPVHPQGIRVQTAFLE